MKKLSGKNLSIIFGVAAAAVIIPAAIGGGLAFAALGQSVAGAFAAGETATIIMVSGGFFVGAAGIGCGLGALGRAAGKKLLPDFNAKSYKNAAVASALAAFLAASAYKQFGNKDAAAEPVNAVKQTQVLKP